MLTTTVKSVSPTVEIQQEGEAQPQHETKKQISLLPLTTRHVWFAIVA